MFIRRFLIAGAVAASSALVPLAAAVAAPASATFAGTITSSMQINNGTNTGSIPAGTPYSGTFSYDTAPTSATASYGGGTHTTYAFSSMSFTIGGSTAQTGPGTIDVFDNVLTSTGYPTGDSVYVNFTGSVAPQGLLAGADFNWMGLAFLDSTGKAVTAGAIPTLDPTRFGTMFSEFNFGTQGTRYGAGNTSMIQSLTQLNGSGGTPPPAVSFAPTLPGGVVGTAYSAPVAAAAGGTGSFSYSASGLPPGLALSGQSVTGTPTVAGTWDVSLTATDTAGASVTSVVPVTIDPAPASAVCSGTGVISSYVARNPGFIVVDGGLNLLDHLWTTNLTAANTTFLGGLVNWYATGLVVTWTGTTDASGCILDSLTVAPPVAVATTSLPNGTVGSAYAATPVAQWGAAPYTWSVSGLPAGLGFDGSRIVGTPQTAGTATVTLSVTDAVGGTASTTVSLTVDPGAATVKDEGKGKITAIGPNASYLMVGTKKITWTGATRIIVNTPTGAQSVITTANTRVGMVAQWKGTRPKSGTTVTTTQVEIN